MPVLTIKHRRLLVVLFIAGLILFSFLSIKWIGGVLYPLNYKEHISKYSQTYDIDPFLIASIIRTESRYYDQAESHKGARGLMQITPSTGEWIAQRLKLKNYTTDALYDPEVNIMMGCWYINNLKKQFDNNLPLVIAAYNGGSGNVDKWLKTKEYSNDGKNLTYIPFKETRNYVEKVQKDYKIYKRLYDEDVFKE